MDYRIALKSFAATALLTGGLCLARPAQAQTTTPTTVPGSPVGTPFISPATSLVPNANNIGFTGTNFANGFSPFFGNPFTFNPFFTNPFFTGFGSPFISTNPIPGPLNPANFASLPPGQGGPLLGVNTPAHTAGGGPVPPAHTVAAIVAPLPLNTGGGSPVATAGAPAVAPGPVTVTNSAPPRATVVMGRAPAAMVATGSAPRVQVASAPRMRVASSPRITIRAVAQPAATKSVRIAQRMERIMRREPMISGRLVKVSGNAAFVSVKQGRKWVTRRYAAEDVFFYRGDQLLDAASARKQLKRGTAVMVPERTARIV